jgi:sarcosine oxidase
MARDFDVIVIGVGAMGSAACYHLARRGLRVLGLEQFSIPNDKGSSHGFSRMIRSAYYEHPDYVPLIRRSFELWHELERESGEKLLHITGGIYIGKPDSEFIAGSLKSAQVHHLPHEMLTRAELARRFPQFHVLEDFAALFEEQAGLIIPEAAIAAHAMLAQRSGAQILTDQRVLSWRTDSAGAAVTTADATWRADQLLFCGGSWTAKLLTDLAPRLIVTRQVIGWVQPRNLALFQLGHFPVWAIDDGDGKIHYGFPILPDGQGLKMGHHKPGVVSDPDTIDRTITEEDRADFCPAVGRYIPDAAGPILNMTVCMYTYSPDGHFIIDRHPNHPRVTFACGFSGHGFKFAPVIGEALADLATCVKTPLPIQFLSSSRLALGGN